MKQVFGILCAACFVYFILALLVLPMAWQMQDLTIVVRCLWRLILCGPFSLVFCLRMWDRRATLKKLRDSKHRVA